MGMLEQAQADIKRIRIDPSGFTKLINLTKKDGSLTVTVRGMHAKIHGAIDTMGNVVNAKKAHISVSEGALNDVGYSVRNANNEVSMIGDKVSVIDSAGILCEYQIRETLPDESVGLIVCFLYDFE
jgi:hypothetical protein